MGKERNDRKADPLSEELWREFRNFPNRGELRPCCKLALSLFEFIETEDPATGGIETIRINYCPQCGTCLKCFRE